MTVPLYGQSLALLTDLYQLTMAYGYWRSGTAQREAVFHLFFRRNPFGGGFAVACGLADAIEFIERFRFDETDLEYLAGLRASDGQPLFVREFLDHLCSLRLRCDIDAIPEGTVIFAHEPLVRVRGPLLDCQLLETPLLNLINFSTLVATKAARVCLAAGNDPVIEFGLRRAQGIDGGVTASRAAYVGGCESTSNVLAGKLFEIPIKGTHAHSWVMSFDDELTAFRAYAEAMPANCVFLVDTYDTAQGVRHAVEAGRWLREQGHEMLGIRLDSGDLAGLSKQARRMLNEGGFPNAKIVASSDLDEYEIAELKRRGAKIDIWGVGTHLATAYDQPALGGVYKLSAVRAADGSWQPKLKVSDDPVKSTNPGVHQVRRFLAAGQMVGDVIFDEDLGVSAAAEAVDLQTGERVTFARECISQDLLVPVYRQGNLAYTPPSIHESRQRTRQQLSQLPHGVKRLQNPGHYHLGLERRLHERKCELIAAAQTKGNHESHESHE
jgi:nicotinate phosphoribosyltransferase